jgi:hypothetical protein
LTPTVAVSFQRTPCPADGVLAELPRSWGALPVLRDGAEGLVVPLPDGEALWIGLLRSAAAPAESLSVVALLEPGGATDAITGRPVGERSPGRLAVPPAAALVGVRRPEGGWWALARVAPARGAPACSEVELRTSVGRLVAHLVTPADFSARSGAELPPLDPTAAYGGRRLP